MNIQYKETVKSHQFSQFNFFLILLFVVFIPATFNHTINDLSLYFIVPCLFLYIVKKNVKIVFNKYLKLFFLLFVWMFVTTVVSRDIDLSIIELKRILGVYLFCVVIYYLASNGKYLGWVYLLYIIKFLYIFIFAVLNYNLLSTDINSERFNNEYLNANMFGYYSFFATYSTFILIKILERKKRVIAKIFHLICILLAIILSFITASRQILISQMLMLFFLYGIDFIVDFKKRYIKYIIILPIIISFSMTYYQSIYDNSMLKKRTETNIKEDQRTYLLMEAINVGIDNPVFGVGPGNYVLYNSERGFSHCSYTELFANNGIVALIIYLLIIIKFLFSIIRLYKRNNKNKIYLYFAVFVIVYFVYNFMYVFYSSNFLLGFLFLIIGHVNVCKNKSLYKTN